MQIQERIGGKFVPVKHYLSSIIQLAYISDLSVIIGWSMITTVKLLMLCIKHGYFGCMGQLSRSRVYQKGYILLVPFNTA